MVHFGAESAVAYLGGDKLIEVYDPSKSISEVAYELDFQYPQHFSRFFKQRVGVLPGEFRGVN
ncbi:MAG: AraC family transcriptional regulator [Saprospiraceae bacterium]|nr:AraC family transcriptional regulator [Saprospiraceae bacterium]